MSITVEELIMHLEAVPQDAEVRLAIQPTWPFQHTIDTFQGVNEVELEDSSGRRETVVYIAEGGQYYRAPYLPEEARRVLGW